MIPRSNRLVLILLAAVLGASVATRLAAQYDGALSLNWGAGDGFATWDGPGALGRVFLETAVATSELLYGVGDYDFPAGTRSLHFQAVDGDGELRSDRVCLGLDGRLRRLHRRVRRRGRDRRFLREPARLAAG